MRYLKGVGPVRAAQLARIGIFQVRDLVHHYPRSYQIRPRLPIAALSGHPGETVIISGKVVNFPQESRKKVSLMTVTIADSSGYVRCTWFNQGYLKAKLKPGTELTAAGKYSRDYGNLVVDEYNLAGPLSDIQAQYSLTEGISNQVMAGLIKIGLEDFREPDLFPDPFRAKYQLLSDQQALKNIHEPENTKVLEQALFTIKFRELFLYQLSFMFWRKLKDQERGHIHRQIPGLLEGLEQSFDFKFTSDQAQAVHELETDMLRPLPMNRLLQGDVGSGKTAVAAFALFTSALNGYKAVFMVPTEVVARQHYETLQKAADKYNIPLYMLTGSTKKSERDQINAALDIPGGVILVGTHAVFQDAVKIKGLALAVTDEQHRFGVHQRLSLVEKGENPHVLVMSATPIPRTLAMTVYGDLDVSTIQAKPGGRREISTYVVHSRQRKKVFEHINQEMAAGNAGYIICPLIEESDTINAASLEKYQDVLAKFLPDWCRYGILHGRLTGAEKDRILASLKSGEIHFLLATTVVEVGVDVGNATFIVVENSERYGLAQLHQLRGRVGRREKQSYCYLITDGQETERLKILEETQDGFAVAMADLKIRGSGQFLGERQHGINEFKLADVLQDTEIAKISRFAAAEVIDTVSCTSEWQPVYHEVLKNIANLKS